MHWLNSSNVYICLLTREHLIFSRLTTVFSESKVGFRHGEVDGFSKWDICCMGSTADFFQHSAELLEWKTCVPISIDDFLHMTPFFWQNGVHSYHIFPQHGFVSHHDFSQHISFFAPNFLFLQTFCFFTQIFLCETGATVRASSKINLTFIFLLVCFDHGFSLVATRFMFDSVAFLRVCARISCEFQNSSCCDAITVWHISHCVTDSAIRWWRNRWNSYWNWTE